MVAVAGRLDRDLGDQLVELVTTAFEVAPRVTLELTGVHHCTPSGHDAIAACRELGASVRDPSRLLRSVSARD